MELTDIAWIMTTASLSAQTQSNRIRADRAEASAADNHLAAAIHAGAARGYASAAAELRSRLIGAESEISRLREINEDLRDERSALIAERSEILTVAADLLTEVEDLKARMH